MARAQPQPERGVVATRRRRGGRSPPRRVIDARVPPIAGRRGANDPALRERTESPSVTAARASDRVTSAALIHDSESEVSLLWSPASILSMQPSATRSPPRFSGHFSM